LRDVGCDRFGIHDREVPALRCRLTSAAAHSLVGRLQPERG
jgi:hypothetical protein